MIDKLLNKETQKFIQDHLHDDPVLLMLQAGRFPHLPMKEIADQIKARQRLKRKLPDWVRNIKIIFPAALSQEQSSSQKTAEYKSKIISGGVLADLTAGAGVDTYYFSKFFLKVHYVEPNKELFEISQHNLSELKASNIIFHNQKAEEFLENNLKVDWIYLDPDRRGVGNKKLFRLSQCEPDVMRLLEKIWQQAQAVLIKTSPMLDISETLHQLALVDSIHVVAVENEVKEVLYILKNKKSGILRINTIDFLNDGSSQEFEFDFASEKTIGASYSEIKKFLYEPNAAILKAGAFKTLTQKYHVSKLHQNTHLYTSDALVSQFPGRIFIVKDIIPFQNKHLSRILPDKKANITTRNFPLSVEDIRKKTGIKDGGDVYLFAATDVNEKHIIIQCKKL